MSSWTELRLPTALHETTTIFISMEYAETQLSGMMTVLDREQHLDTYSHITTCCPALYQQRTVQICADRTAQQVLSVDESQ